MPHQIYQIQLTVTHQEIDSLSVISAMTADDIVRIVVTVAIAQFACDAIAYWRIFSQEPYQRAVAAYGRAKWKKDKAKKDAQELGINTDGSTETTPSTNTSGKQKSQNKILRTQKAWERADQDCNDAAAMVSRRFMLPNFLTSILFVILLRIMGLEYKGQIMALLPFTPWSFFQRVSARGLEFSDLAYEQPTSNSLVTETGQAASFVVIYMLTGLSVKFYVNKLFGTKPPPGADGMMNLTQSSWGKRWLASVGVDPNELKME